MSRDTPSVFRLVMLKNQHTGRLAPRGAAMAGLSIFLLLTLALPRAQRAEGPDVRELLVAARGVAPAICALAADGVWSGGWGSGWSAPITPISSDLRGRLRSRARSERGWPRRPRPRRRPRSWRSA